MMTTAAVKRIPTDVAKLRLPEAFRATCRFCETQDQVIITLPATVAQIHTSCRDAQCTVCGGLLVAADDAASITRVLEANELYPVGEDDASLDETDHEAAPWIEQERRAG